MKIRYLITNEDSHQQVYSGVIKAESLHLIFDLMKGEIAEFVTWSKQQGELNLTVHLEAVK